MQRKNGSESERAARHEHPLSGETRKEEKKITDEAHRQADKDMDEDVELSAHSPNDDLDESETARLGEDKTDLV